MEIRKIMEKPRALQVLDEIKNNLFEVDLDALCGEEVKIEETKEEKEFYKKLIQAIMCGLVYWDEEDKCLVQKLIKPVKSGQQEADELRFKNQLKLEDARQFNAKNQAELSIQSLATICGRSNQIVGQLSGQDLTIAVACLSFFDK